jgi:hypothetical protein
MRFSVDFTVSNKVNIIFNDCESMEHLQEKINEAVILIKNLNNIDSKVKIDEVIEIK